MISVLEKPETDIVQQSWQNLDLLLGNNKSTIIIITIFMWNKIITNLCLQLTVWIHLLGDTIPGKIGLQVKGSQRLRPFLISSLQSPRYFLVPVFTPYLFPAPEPETPWHHSPPFSLFVCFMYLCGYDYMFIVMFMRIISSLSAPFPWPSLPDSVSGSRLSEPHPCPSCKMTPFLPSSRDLLPWSQL